MSTSIVHIEQAPIRTTAARDEGDITRLVESFLSNSRNENKIIGLDTERSVVEGENNDRPTSKLAVLELCDGDYCLIVSLSNDCDKFLPVSLINFLNLPEFTFVGVGINKTLKLLERECGLTCKNAVEIGPSSWDIFSDLTSEKCRIIRQFVSFRKPTSAIFEDWYNFGLDQNQIELAAANAYFAFKIGKLLMTRY